MPSKIKIKYTPHKAKPRAPQLPDLGNLDTKINIKESPQILAAFHLLTERRGLGNVSKIMRIALRSYLVSVKAEIPTRPQALAIIERVKSDDLVNVVDLDGN